MGALHCSGPGQRIVEDLEPVGGVERGVGELAAGRGHSVFQIWRLRDAASAWAEAWAMRSVPPFPHPSSCIVRRAGPPVRPELRCTAMLHCSSGTIMAQQPRQTKNKRCDQSLQAVCPRPKAVCSSDGVRLPARRASLARRVRRWMATTFRCRIKRPALH